LRVVIAAASNGGGYANIFRTKEHEDGLGILELVLAELWDFDTRISSDDQGNPAPQDYLESRNKPLRGYNQTNPNPEASFRAFLPDSRWKNYYDDNSIPAEVPPLPPGPYNDTGGKDSRHTLYFTHHLIRDFMFLDATLNNRTNDIPSGPAAWPVRDNSYPYQVARIGLDLGDNETQVANYTQGIGHHPNKKYLLNDSTFKPEANGPLLDFAESTDNVAFTALLYELQDNSSKNAATVVPNWFGVAVPDGITDFRNVIIYFHPNPTQNTAGYNSSDYQSKSGKHGTNWKELFAYVDRLGNQLAGAAKYAGDVSNGDPKNQIVIFPFMKSYDDVGILPKYWYFIVKDILDDIYTKGV
jgi:hypothetical protein